MSKIVIFSKGSLDAKSIHFIHKVTGKSLSDIVESQRSGSPVAEYALFGNDYRGVAEKIKLLANTLSVSLDFYEIDDATDLSISGIYRREDLSQHRISRTTLLNIIASAEGYE